MCRFLCNTYQNYSPTAKMFEWGAGSKPTSFLGRIACATGDAFIVGTTVLAFQASGISLLAPLIRGVQSVCDFMETTPGAENPNINHDIYFPTDAPPTSSKVLLSTLKDVVVNNWDSRCSGDFDSGTVDECVALYEECTRMTLNYRLLCEYQITEKGLKTVFPDLDCASSFPDWQNDPSACESFLNACHNISSKFTPPLCFEPQHIFKKN